MKQRPDYALLNVKKFYFVFLEKYFYEPCIRGRDSEQQRACPAVDTPCMVTERKGEVLFSPPWTVRTS